MAQSPIKQHEIQFNAIEFHWLFDLVDQQYGRLAINSFNNHQFHSQSIQQKTTFCLCVVDWWDEMMSWLVASAPPNKPQINEFHSHENSIDLLVLFGLAARGVSSLALSPIQPHQSTNKIKLFNFLWLMVSWMALSSLRASCFAPLACLLSSSSLGGANGAQRP